ncbi:MAG: heavy metal transport/detoxification protein [Chloroflexi bacterium HGW-Chloroflexi-2]|jgi:copper chaperone CopZ|nr:MAG: heavy metal transport/detoxification protein [Chloroflexi bacterium HGW-Chloroflexi-2]
MKTILRSKELTCPSCIAKIEKALTKIEGVETAKVFFSTGRIEVEHNADLVQGKDLEKAIQAVGYEARVSAF